MQVDIVAATTLDGFIGRDESHKSTTWTSPEDTKFYVSKIKEAGVVVVGRKTFETFTRYPKGLTFVVYTSKPDEFVNPSPDVIKAFGTDLEPAKLLEKLEKMGHEHVVISGGGSIYTQFMKAGVVDKLFITVEPVIFGRGVKLFNQEITDADLKLVKKHELSEQSTVFELEVKR